MLDKYFQFSNLLNPERGCILVDKQIINIPATPLGVVQNEIFLFTKTIKKFVEPRWGSGNTTLAIATDIRPLRGFYKK